MTSGMPATSALVEVPVASGIDTSVKCRRKAYAFRPARSGDLPLLHAWQHSEAVRRWWIESDGQPAPLFDHVDLRNPDIRMWIVSASSGPFAFIQDYNPHAWPEHHFNDLPAGSRGIDQFIGEPSMIGLGHGPAFIYAHVLRMFEWGVPAVGTDPHPDNTRAIRAYEKAGFARLDRRVTAWGDCQRMVIYRP